jgi:hypothetical protein
MAASRKTERVKFMCKARQAVGRWRAGRFFSAEWAAHELNEDEHKLVTADPMIDVRDPEAAIFKMKPTPSQKQVERAKKDVRDDQVKALVSSASRDDLIALAVSEQIAVREGATAEEIAAALIGKGVLA